MHFPLLVPLKAISIGLGALLRSSLKLPYINGHLHYVVTSSPCRCTLCTVHSIIFELVTFIN